MASVFTFAGSAVALVPVVEKSGKDNFQDVSVAKGTGKVLYLNLEMRGFMFSLLDWNAYERSSRWENNYQTKIFHPHEPPVIYSFHCSREYSWFASDVTAAMLVYRTMVKEVFWEFGSIIMQNLSDILPLFCTPTCPPHHVSATQE